MSGHPDGGPAFAPTSRIYDNEAKAYLNGMSLRDYFAAKAMQAQTITDMVPGPACEALLEAAERDGQDPVYRLALNSYEIADAMLLARQA